MDIVQQTTNPEPDVDSAAAIVGGVLSGLILAILAVLFFLVIMLVIKERSKGGAPVSGVLGGNGVPIENGVQLTNVEPKPEASMQTSNSIEKLNDDLLDTPTASTTDKMDEIL